MARLLFEKTGNAVWISHLDLMRLFQRAFKRAGLPLKHTQGFNPRPSVSIALPLSVGVWSYCELLDFELDEAVSCDTILQKLNAVLVEGIQVKAVYENGRKLRDLSLLACSVTLEYDEGFDAAVPSDIEDLFRADTLTVEKKGKNGIVEQNLIPMIRRLTAVAADENTIRLDALICCQNPTLNPTQLVAAIEKYLPHCKPDHAVCCRKEIYDTNETIFR